MESFAIFILGAAAGAIAMDAAWAIKLGIAGPVLRALKNRIFG